MSTPPPCPKRDLKMFAVFGKNVDLVHIVAACLDQTLLWPTDFPNARDASFDHVSSGHSIIAQIHFDNT